MASFRYSADPRMSSMGDASSITSEAAFFNVSLVSGVDVRVSSHLRARRMVGATAPNATLTVLNDLSTISSLRVTAMSTIEIAFASRNPNFM